MVAKSKKNQKSSWQNVFFSVLLGALILVVVIFLIVSNWKINQKRTEYNAQLEILQRELQALQLKRQQLQAQISQTGEESYLEAQAREQFNLKKEGEEVIAVLPAEEETIEEPAKGFWGNLLDKLKFW